MDFVLHGVLISVIGRYQHMDKSALFFGFGFDTIWIPFAFCLDTP